MKREGEERKKEKRKKECGKERESEEMREVKANHVFVRRKLKIRTHYLCEGDYRSVFQSSQILPSLEKVKEGVLMRKREREEKDEGKRIE